jgi:hypothetical protein
VRTPFKEKTFVEKLEENEKKNLENHLKIDNSAFVVNGKLVYLKDEENDIQSDKKKLMKILKENKISYKNYIMGNKK